MAGAAKFFAWLNRVLCWLGMIAVIALSSILGPKNPSAFVLLLFLFDLIPSALLSGKMIKSINDMDKQIWIGIIGIIFVSPLGGIFYLCWQPYSYSSTPKSSYSYFAPTSNLLKTQSVPHASASPKKEETIKLKPEYALLQIKKLYDLGILNKEQYDIKVEKYKKLI